MAKIVFFELFPKDILKKTSIFLAHWRKSATFAALKCCGTLAEWLGNGLQNRVQQFESARYLKKNPAFFNRKAQDFVFCRFQL